MTENCILHSYINWGGGSRLRILRTPMFAPSKHRVALRCVGILQCSSDIFTLSGKFCGFLFVFVPAEANSFLKSFDRFLQKRKLTLFGNAIAPQRTTTPIRNRDTLPLAIRSTCNRFKFKTAETYLFCDLLCCFKVMVTVL